MAAVSTIAGSTKLASDAFGGGSGGGGSQNQTITNRVAVPSFLKDLSEQQAGVAGGALTGLEGLLNDPRLSQFNQDEQQAIDIARGVAGGEGGFIPAAQQQFLQTAQGDFNSDFFNNAFQSALRQAQPEISSAFSLAGRSGSGLEATAQSQAAANAFGNLFNAERNRQMQAAQQLPGIGLAGSSIFQNIGGLQRQRELQAPISAQQQLQQAAGGPIGLGNFLGQTQTSSQPMSGGNSLLQGLGGAATGAGIGQSVGFLSPGAGAGLGALAGLLG